MRQGSSSACVPDQSTLHFVVIDPHSCDVVYNTVCMRAPCAELGDARHALHPGCTQANADTFDAPGAVVSRCKVTSLTLQRGRAGSFKLAAGMSCGTNFAADSQPQQHCHDMHCNAIAADKLGLLHRDARQIHERFTCSIHLPHLRRFDQRQLNGMATLGAFTAAAHCTWAGKKI